MPARHDASGRSPDFERMRPWTCTTGLLDGLEGERARGARQLLERCSRKGFSERGAEGGGRRGSARAAAGRARAGRHVHRREVEERAGVAASLVIRIRRLLGLPEPGAEERVFSDEDIAAAQSTQLFLDAGLAEEAIVEITRVLGEGDGAAGCHDHRGVRRRVPASPATARTTSPCVSRRSPKSSSRR